jgi:RNA polymerase sigma factor (sigma-70 family)
MAGFQTACDLDLLTAIRADDKDAFRFLYDRHWKALYIRACKSVNEDEAKDMIQEVMVSFWKRRNQISITHEDDIGKYLFTALKYRIITFYTYTSSSIKKSFLFDPAVPDSPEEILENKELGSLLDSTIESMPGRMQEIFRMSRDENISVADIAFKLNISEQTVKNQITLALKRLKATVVEYRTGDWIAYLFVLLYSNHR